MRAFSAIALASALAGLAESGDPLRVSFHHIHVNDRVPANLISYYGKLFRPETTRATRIGEIEGVEAGGVFLLINPSRVMPPESGSAGWHFGWGTVSLDEAYDRHRMQEIDWELPLESFAKELHLHLESADPVAAGVWYRDRLGAALESALPSERLAEAVNAARRRPMAIARFERVALAIYKSAAPLEPSRGHRIDHIAFTADLNEARRAEWNVLERSGKLGAFETMTIEGPDQLAIELIGPVVPPAP